MSETRRQKGARIFYAVVVAGLVFWILVTGSFMSHVANLWFVIPVVTVIVAFVVRPAPVYMLVATFGLHILNLCFFDFTEPWNDVRRSGGWTLIVVAIAGNSALVGAVAWRMRATRTTIADQKAGRQGLLLKAIGVMLWLLSTFVTLIIWLEPPSHDAEIYYVLVLGLPILGGYLWYRGRQYDAIARSKVFENDRRPPVLYLRSFARDESVWQASLSFLFNPQLLPRGRGEGEQLAEAVSPIGPLLAVGKPGEALPAPGAHRI